MKLISSENRNNDFKIDFEVEGIILLLIVIIIIIIQGLLSSSFASSMETINSIGI